MNIAIARGEWHGLSLEDLFLAIAGVIFAFVLALLFNNGIAHRRIPPVRPDPLPDERETPPSGAIESKFVEPPPDESR